jgi:hypothetical protein
MTMRERFCDAAPEAGLGEAAVLEVDGAGEARASLEVPAPVCAAAEDASCETAWGAAGRERADSSWAPGCCPAGEKGDEADEASDDLRLPTSRGLGGGRDGKLAVGEGVSRAWAVVEMGGRRALGFWLCLGAPQGFWGWLIERAGPWAGRDGADGEAGGRGGGERRQTVDVAMPMWMCTEEGRALSRYLRHWSSTGDGDCTRPHTDLEHVGLLPQM